MTDPSYNSSLLLKPYVIPAVVACFEIDDAELIVHQLVEEILQKSQDILFEKHISSQVLPYAIQNAKDTVLRLAMWEFFDEDLVDPCDSLWIPDQEPDPLPFDSWARGTLTSYNKSYVPETQDSPIGQSIPLSFPLPTSITAKPIVPWNAPPGYVDHNDEHEISLCQLHSGTGTPSPRRNIFNSNASIPVPGLSSSPQRSGAHNHRDNPSSVNQGKHVSNPVVSSAGLIDEETEPIGDINRNVNRTKREWSRTRVVTESSMRIAVQQR